jgi:hypothetical protein
VVGLMFIPAEEDEIVELVEVVATSVETTPWSEQNRKAQAPCGPALEVVVDAGLEPATPGM